MDGDDTASRDGPFGSGAFAFAEWRTPFTNAPVAILDVRYAPRGTEARRIAHPADQDGHDLVARVRIRDTQAIYRVTFTDIAAMRLLDEGGLLEFWQKTEARGGRPGRTTFRVRNHAWTRESVISFLPSDGWSYVIASDDECLEVVSAAVPQVTAETPPAP